MKQPIEVFHFQPFKSRQGVDTCIGLRFRYSPALVSCLKNAIRFIRDEQGGTSPGGWLPQFGAWFVEPSVWPTVRDHLIRSGYTLVETEPEATTSNFASREAK